MLHKLSKNLTLIIFGNLDILGKESFCNSSQNYAKADFKTFCSGPLFLVLFTLFQLFCPGLSMFDRVLNTSVMKKIKKNKKHWRYINHSIGYYWKYMEPCIKQNSQKSACVDKTLTHFVRLGSYPITIFLSSIKK